jgi:hypothetical protein
LFVPKEEEPEELEGLEEELTTECGKARERRRLKAL